MGDNLYVVLGVSEDADTDELRIAYRRLARRHHPDLNPDDGAAPDRFRRITDAYRMLLDPARRAEHDREVLGRRASDVPEAPGRTNVFQEAGRRQASHGRDVVTVLPLDLEEAARGGWFDVEVTGPVRCSDCGGEGWDVTGEVVTCWTCHGTGVVTFEHRHGSGTGVCLTCGGEKIQHVQGCPTCGGDGTVVSTRVVRVNVPPGIDDGDTITAAGEGGPGGSGGTPGDLLVVVQVRPHPIFRRDGLDLVVDVPITYPEAVFGADVRVPTLDRHITVRIPPGTQGGSVHRITGRGISNGESTGDLLVATHIVVPTTPSDQERSLLEILRRYEPRGLRDGLAPRDRR